MLQTNIEIDHVVSEATAIARAFKHEYVTLEHVFLSMVRYEPFKTLLEEFGADTKSLDEDLFRYLKDESLLHTSGGDPKKTHSLERVFNRALTQVLFSQRTQLQIMDLFISI